jgi:hypothetical protein
VQTHKNKHIRVDVRLVCASVTLECGVRMQCSNHSKNEEHCSTNTQKHVRVTADVWGCNPVPVCCKQVMTLAIAGVAVPACRKRHGYTHMWALLRICRECHMALSLVMGWPSSAAGGPAPPPPN